MNGQKQDLIKRSTAELLALESQIEDVLKGQLEVVQPHPQAAAAVQQFRFMTKSHQDTLEAYLQTIGGSSLEHPDTTIPSRSATDDTHWFPISDALRYDYILFNYAAITYAMLVEIAFKLYDPALRKIGPQHLEGYAEAVRTINRMIAGVIGWDVGCADDPVGTLESRPNKLDLGCSRHDPWNIRGRRLFRRLLFVGLAQDENGSPDARYNREHRFRFHTLSNNRSGLQADHNSTGLP